jgi:hypothetical protein
MVYASFTKAPSFGVAVPQQCVAAEHLAGMVSSLHADPTSPSFGTLFLIQAAARLDSSFLTSSSLTFL